MVYTEKEIVRDYKNSRSPKAQISILAELNGVTSEEIKEILIRNGAMDAEKETRKEKNTPEKVKLPMSVLEAVTIHKRKLEKNINDIRKDLNEIENFLNEYKAST